MIRLMLQLMFIEGVFEYQRYALTSGENKIYYEIIQDLTEHAAANCKILLSIASMFLIIFWHNQTRFLIMETVKWDVFCVG